MSVYNLVSAGGIVFFIAFLFLFSQSRRRVSFRVIFWGIALQILFALFVFLFPLGAKFFLFLNDATMKLIDSAFEGIRFLFGPLATAPGEAGSLGFILAFQALPSIIFFAALMELLYHVGLMEKLIDVFARIFRMVMGISGAESLCASAQIFLGIESNLTVRPYLSKMTKSELLVVLTTGMATIASSVLGFYVIILAGVFPTVAGHLISASILLAPSAILASKIIIPETEIPLTLGKVVKVEYTKADNVIEAIINGAMAGVKMVVGIGALLIAFIGLVSLVDVGLLYAGKGLGFLLKTPVDITINHILQYVFYPFTVAMGVPPVDAPAIAKIIGERIIMTEVKSYQDLSLIMKEGKIVYERSAVIATYALCGFAHVPSLAIFVGGTSSLVPERTKDIAILGLWSLLAANVACFITGAVAGLFYTGGGGILLHP
ncbi:MAG TPA: nucleoside transporter C-terminal domain-containing protein [Syntrophorhabdaceae bacterium]|nr:nucleoside transporter C-terminal domain-containing protein [Syntrophorhabdaceae bacterium]